MKKFIAVLSIVALLSGCSWFKPKNKEEIPSPKDVKVEKISEQSNEVSDYLKKAEEAKEKLIKILSPEEDFSFFPIARAQEQTENTDIDPNSPEELIAQIEANLDFALQSAIKESDPIILNQLLDEIQSSQEQILFELRGIRDEILKDTLRIIEENIQIIDSYQQDIEEAIEKGEEKIEIKIFPLWEKVPGPLSLVRESVLQKRKERMTSWLNHQKEVWTSAGLSEEKIKEKLSKRKDKFMEKHSKWAKELQILWDEVREEKISKDELRKKFFDLRQKELEKIITARYEKIKTEDPQKAETFKKKADDHKKWTEQRFQLNKAIQNAVKKGIKIEDEPESTENSMKETQSEEELIDTEENSENETE